MVQRNKYLKYLNLPNILTASRIVLLPVFLILVARAEDVRSAVMAAIVFTVIAISDALDGFFARKLNLTSSFGAIFDPIADKIVIITTYLYLANVIHPVVVTLVVLRDVMIIALFGILYLVMRVRELHVSPLGKTSTIFQMTLVIAVLVSSHLPNWLLITHSILTAVFTVASGARYLIVSVKYFKKAY